MPNLVVYNNTSEEILYFFENAVVFSKNKFNFVRHKKGNITLRKSLFLNYLWTDEIIVCYFCHTLNVQSLLSESKIEGEWVTTQEVFKGVEYFQPPFIRDRITGWSKAVSEINSISDPGNTNELDFNDSMIELEKLKSISNLSEEDLENYILANVTDLPSARVYIIKLSKVVLALIKLTKQIVLSRGIK